VARKSGQNFFNSLRKRELREGRGKIFFLARLNGFEERKRERSLRFAAWGRGQTTGQRRIGSSQGETSISARLTDARLNGPSAQAPPSQPERGWRGGGGGGRRGEGGLRVSKGPERR